MYGYGQLANLQLPNALQLRHINLYITIHFTSKPAEDKILINTLRSLLLADTKFNLAILANSIKFTSNSTHKY